MSGSLVVNEIYRSLQGESTFAGLPCIFVRLTGCNLRCSYCDTAYAFTAGGRMEVDAVHARILALTEGFPGEAGGIRLPLVEFTGGEPLLQAPVRPLMARLCGEGFTVLVETSGAHDIGGLDPRVRRIMDLKCPGSGEAGRNRWENLDLLRSTDEVKFVISTREDYDWARAVVRERGLERVCPVLFSWAAPLLPAQRDKSLRPVPDGSTPIARRELVEAIIRDCLPVRFQLQMHKFIWPPDERGV